MATSRGGVLLLLLPAVTYAVLPVPWYIKTCARSDPSFNKCALQSGQEALPNFLKGDRKYRVPNLTPLEIKELRVDQGPRQAGFAITLRDVKVHGLDRAEVKRTDFDFEKKTIEVDVKAQHLSILGNYAIRGRVLVVPIVGNGDINITLVNNNYRFSVHFDLQEVKGHTHLVVYNPQGVIEPTRAYMYLTNLFNGDKRLGNEMNKFINENWRDVFREMAPAISAAFSEVVAAIVNSISKGVAYGDLFPESLP